MYSLIIYASKTIIPWIYFLISSKLHWFSELCLGCWLLLNPCEVRFTRITWTAERCVLLQKLTSSIKGTYYNGAYRRVDSILSISWPRSCRKVLLFSENTVIKSKEAFLRFLSISIFFNIFLNLLNTSRRFLLVLTSRPISLRIYKNNMLMVRLIDKKK